MRVVRLTDFKRSEFGCSATVGNFDGLHLGHRAIIAELRRIAEVHGLNSVLLTFSLHPRLVMGKEKGNFLLTTLDEKKRMLRELGTDLLAVMDFTEEMKEMSAERFVEEVLIGTFNVRWLVTGSNHRFGRRNEGDVCFLAGRLAQWGLSLSVIPPIRAEGGAVNSTRIRELVRSGNVETASRLLSSPYRIEGEVVRGERIGSRLGFHTANLKLPVEKVKPADGVYAVSVSLEGETRFGVMNIGVRPTVRGRDRTYEVHLIDFKGDLYGKTLAVEFRKRLRDERTYGSEEDLADQIRRDIERARETLSIS
jgi:riboflavin kinase/FMN adenylyltransferase